MFTHAVRSRTTVHGWVQLQPHPSWCGCGCVSHVTAPAAVLGSPLGRPCGRSHRAHAYRQTLPSSTPIPAVDDLMFGGCSANQLNQLTGKEGAGLGSGLSLSRDEETDHPQSKPTLLTVHHDTTTRACAGVASGPRHPAGCPRLQPACARRGRGVHGEPGGRAAPQRAGAAKVGRGLCTGTLGWGGQDSHTAARTAQGGCVCVCPLDGSANAAQSPQGRGRGGRGVEAPGFGAGRCRRGPRRQRWELRAPLLACPSTRDGQERRFFGVLW